MSRIYRIKDIAELAGVSTGTVDRILHKRGRVSAEAREKVEKVLQEIDYHPNLIARSLALKKEYKIVILLPSFSEGDYWNKFNEGLIEAKRTYSSYNVKIEPLYFDVFDKSSFDKLIPQIEAIDCQGVIITTHFKDSVVELSKQLDGRQIPYILADAYVEGTNCLTYYGNHSYDSGLIAGRILFEQIKPSDDIVIFRFFHKGNQYSTQVTTREQGFREYLSSAGHRGEIHTVAIHADKPEQNAPILDRFFEDHSHINKGIIFNSRAYIVGKYLSEKENTNAFSLIGYDAIDANVEYLNRDYISHLIAQRPEVQGFNCVKTLFRYLILGHTPKAINYMPIDILLKENIKYYDNYI